MKADGKLKWFQFLLQFKLQSSEFPHSSSKLNIKQFAVFWLPEKWPQHHWRPPVGKDKRVRMKEQETVYPSETSKKLHSRLFTFYWTESGGTFVLNLSHRCILTHKHTTFRLVFRHLFFFKPLFDCFNLWFLTTSSIILNWILSLFL